MTYNLFISYQLHLYMSKIDNKIEESEEINLRSEEVQEIMGRVPPWIERWGITVIALILVVLLAGAALFPYPDTLTGRFIFLPETGKKELHMGYAMLPVQGIGQVKRGQAVKIRLENYPDREYGYLTGKVHEVAYIPDDNGLYQVNIIFPNGLKTSEGDFLPTKRQMSGTAEIVVADKRLIDRLGIMSSVTKHK